MAPGWSFGISAFDSNGVNMRASLPRAPLSAWLIGSDAPVCGWRPVAVRTPEFYVFPRSTTAVIVATLHLSVQTILGIRFHFAGH